MSTLDEQEIQALLSEGNDEEIVHLVYTLSRLQHNQVTQRVVLLEDLSERYLTLVLARESGIAQDVEEALKRLYDGSLALPPEPLRDASAIDWYGEAIQYLEEALRQVPESFDKSRTIRLACLAHALSGEICAKLS